MKKNKIKEVIKPLIGLFFCFLMVGLGMTLLSLLEIFSTNSSLKIKCDTYKNEYNILTEYIDNNFLSYDKCFVLMEDGSKVNIKDFDISVVKVPLKSRN